MEIKQSVAAAKAMLQDVLGGELASGPRLEKVWLDGSTGAWIVRPGFYRAPGEKIGGLPPFPTYDYKVVVIDDKSERLISIKSPERDAA